MSIEIVQFGTFNIGDHSYISISFDSPIIVRTFPRLIGVKIYSTQETGGGLAKITVKGWIKRNNHQEIESYFANLPVNLGFDSKTLTAGTQIINDCVFSSMSHSNEDKNYAFFTIIFLTGVQNI